MCEVRSFKVDNFTLPAARHIEEDRNCYKTKEETEALSALIQLRRLWWEWKDEKPVDKK